MSDSVWGLFPYPTIANGELTDGATMPAHADCIKCPNRACIDDDSPVAEPRICRYGLTYARVDDERRILGVVAKGEVRPTSRANRRFKLEPERVVRSDHIRAAVASAHRLGSGAVESFERARDELLAKLQSDPDMYKAMADQLRKDFDSNLEQSHDFLQLVKQVKGYAEVLLRGKHPHLDPEIAAEKEPTEGAIYFATTLMTLKVDSLVFLNEVNRAFGGERPFELHPLLLKYVRIYSWQANQKELDISITGKCWAICRYNQQAMIAVIQGLLDNLVKYAPARSKAYIVLEESDQSVAVTFDSLGPRIAESERSNVFLPGFRGAAARELEETGQGIGLATVKQLSDVLSLDVSVDQDDEEDSHYIGLYRTRFRFSVVKTDSAEGRSATANPARRR